MDWQRRIAHKAFRHALLDDAFFKMAQLRGADFRSASLRGVHFYGCDLRDADFRWADLTDAVFTHQGTHDPEYGRTDVTGARWDGARLKGTRFERVIGRDDD